MTTPFSQFGPIGFPELLVFALVVLLLFGHRLPGVMRSVGRGMIEFKKGLRGEQGGEEPPEERRAAEPEPSESEHEARRG